MRWLALLLCAALCGCANQMTPRGAPVDRMPPMVDSTVPQNGAVNATPSEVDFVFPEVVSEKPQGASDLAGMFLISPSAGAPRVAWHRNKLSVRPRSGWLPNTTYTVTMLPGFVDLQNNVSKVGATMVFSTGARIDSARITGILFDWVAERPTPRAIVRARLVTADTGAAQRAQRDTAVYSAVTDSTGRFILSNLPNGVYEIRGFIDGNANRALDSLESYDSTRVTLSDSARVELLAFTHDSNPPRMLAPVVRDSFTFSVQFSRPIDPAQVLDTALFHLLALPESAAVPIVLVRPERVNERVLSPADSARRDSLARLDSIRRAQNPGQVVTPVVVEAVIPSRPKPPLTLLFQVGTPLAAGKSYLLRAGAVRGLLGTSLPNETTFTRAAPGRGGGAPVRRE